MVVYRIGASDAEFLTKELPGVSVNDMVNLDRFQVYAKLLINLTPSKPFSMKGIKSDVSSNKASGEIIRQLSRLKYCQEKFEVQTQVAENLPKLAVAVGGNEPLSRA
jgi:hypothetical protein